MGGVRLCAYRETDINAMVLEVDYLTSCGKARTHRWAMRSDGKSEAEVGAALVARAVAWLQRPVYVHPATGREFWSDIAPEFREAALAALRERAAHG